MLDEHGLTTNHDKVYHKVLKKIAEQTGVEVKFEQCVIDLIYHTSMIWWKKYQNVDNISEEIFNKIFSLDGYSPEDIHYIKDVELNLPTSYGFIIDNKGDLFHLVRQYNHGLVLASLNPIHALNCGFFAPPMHGSSPSLSVYDYQKYEMRHCENLNFIRFSSGYYDAISFEKSTVNEAQLKTLKTWLTNMSMLDDNVSTDIGDTSNRKVVVEIDKLIAHRKLNSQYELSEPKTQTLE